MIGRTLSHYKVLEEISRGGMGIVYRALDFGLAKLHGPAQDEDRSALPTAQIAFTE